MLEKTETRIFIKMPENVTIFLQYKTSISNSQYSGQEFDILLLVKSVDTKQIVFYETSFIDYGTKRKKGYYIIKDNFLKEYGGLLPENFSCPSITEIKQIIEDWRLKQIEKQREAETRQTKPLWLTQGSVKVGNRFSRNSRRRL